MDNVLRQVPHAALASFRPSARPAHNISPLRPAFNPERLQVQCHPRMDEDEVTSNLRFLEIHRSQRAPFVTNSSRLMERIPSMRQ
ncbi:hypothetical protein P3S68_003183 [Capsicum galapagoense]